MTIRRTILLAGLLAVPAAAARPASASVYYVTYTGTASGTDTNGVFGAAGATLNNVAFTSTYSYDPTQFGNAAVTTTSTANYVYGGSQYGLTDPLLSASVTINGVTYIQASSFYGVALVQSSANSQFDEEAESSTVNALYNDGYATGPVAVPSLTALQSISIPGGGNNGYFTQSGERINFFDTQFTVSDTAPPGPIPVPEPASLALLAGASCVLAAVRRTRRATARGFTEAQGGTALA